MSKRILLLSAISYLLCFSVNAQSHKTNFTIALEAKNMSKAEEILKAWDFADANDPDLYIAYFNFYTVKSMDAGLLGKNGFDTKFSKQALDFITEGIERFPTRFDMRVAKMYMLRKLNDCPAYIEEVMKMIVFSDKIKNNWKGMDFTIVDKPDEMFFDAVLDCQEFLFLKDDPSLYKEIFRISDEMLKYYPKHVQSLLNKSTVYVKQKEYDKSLEELEKAIQFEPTNAILFYNVAFVYNLKDEKANAKKFYELTIMLCTEKEAKMKEVALMRLEALK
jgi:tetratricopeptide (TPR) repeat protein